MRPFLKNLQNYLIAFFALMSIAIIIIGINRLKKNPLVDISTNPPLPPPSSNNEQNTNTELPTNTGTRTEANGSFTGNTYHTPYGSVAASIEVKGGKIVGVAMPSVPNSPPSLYAEPYLIDQALKAGGANIQGVSGATYTSIAFKSSLESAIAKAGIQANTSVSGSAPAKTTPAPSVPRRYRDDD